MCLSSVGNSVTFLPMRNEAARAAGQSIRAVRELAGLTIAQAAELVGGSAGYLSQVETGTAKNVSEKYVANTMSALSNHIARIPNPEALTTEASSTDAEVRQTVDAA